MNSLRKKDIITLILAIVLFGVLQFLMAERIIGSFWELNIFLVCVNIIMAASLNLINGYTGQFSLGHAGFMAVGAYVGVILTVNFHSPFIVALLIGGFAAGILGFLIGLPTLRLKGDYLAIATLGLGEIIRIVIMNIEYVGGAAGFKGIPHNTTFPWVFFIMLFTLFFIKNFVNSKYGRSCIAVRENEIAAEAMGVNTTKYKVMAFTFGEQLNEDTAVIHVEKADPDVNGAYTAINQAFVANTWQDMTYINREEDMGIEGLRKAKESYRPVKMIKKFTAIFKG